MRHRGPLFVVTCVGLAVGAGYLLSASPVAHQAVASVRASLFSPAPVSQAAPPVHTVAPAQPAPAEPSDNPVRFMFAQVAQQYEQSSRYPSYSIPLTAQQADAYAGNHYDAVTLPLSGGGQFAVNLEKYRFTRGESILVVASVQGPMVVGQQVSARLEAVGAGSDTASAKLEPTPDGFFEGALDSELTPGEYRLVVEATIDGQSIRHVSTLTIEPFLGEFESVGTTHIQNNDLIIPVEFKAEDAGYYAFSANLYVSGQPVAHLTRERQMDASRSTIDFKVHGSVLAGRASHATMQLKGLQIRRLPARPGDRTDYGFGPDDGFEFDATDLDSLKDTPARDPESEQRAALLKKLAAGA